MRLLAVLLLFVAACGSRVPPYLQLEADDLLAWGMDHAERRKWDDAARALERFVYQFPTHPRYQEARFRLAEVYAGKKEYLGAASEFARLADEFPAGPYADHARFRVCEMYERLSPRPQLDQEYTYSAIDHCRSLLTFYPDSEYSPRARAVIAQLENRLAEKVYLNGEFYFRRSAFDPAIVYYDELLKVYPSSEFAPKALLRLYEAYTRIGYADEASETRERLLRDFPDSEEARRIRGAANRP